MTAFRTRRTEAADEAELNSVFNRFIGRRTPGKTRSIDQMRWLWHKAPGGKALSWLIEAQSGSSWKIVGHHALGPVRFTFGDEDWLCAKTMNSFLLPEYRDKFLYLRFEKDCLEESGRHFDATYSIAPGTARLRRPCGYECDDSFLWLERSFRPHYLMCRAASYLLGRHSLKARQNFSRAISHLPAFCRSRTSTIEFAELTPEEAAASDFFADFWAEARGGAGMAPRRDRADLEWRFWKNPGFKGVTLTFTGAAGDQAYFIVDTADPLFYSLVDFYAVSVPAQRLGLLFDALFDWCTRHGALSMKFVTSTNGLPAPWMEVVSSRMRPFCVPIRSLAPSADLPRRLSPRGRTRLAKLPHWNYTPILIIDAF